MTACPVCQSGVPDGKRFCGDCGAPQFVNCSQCHSESPIGKAYCADCGNHLSAVTKVEKDIEIASDERRVISVLFADIKGSMELIEDLDPEEARKIVEPALKLMIEAVLHYGGYVVQTTGDGIFAMFGAPQIHEDHPHRALYASLKMQSDLKGYSSRLKSQGYQSIQGRVGVNTGEAVVRSIRLGEGQIEYTPIGHSTSLGARLQTHAPINSVATSTVVKQLCEGYFNFKELGPTRVKGVSELVEVYEVTGVGQLRTRLKRAVGQGLSKFVGRQNEIELLVRNAQQVQSGRGQVVAAIANAGTGKSRLFYEFINTSRTGWLVLETFSVAHGQNSPFHTLIELLHAYFNIEEVDSIQARREKIATKLDSLDMAGSESLPVLTSFLGANDDAPLSREEFDEELTHQIFDSINALFVRESLRQPLILLFEDLHWVDEFTQRFLDTFVDGIASTKILLLVNYRPEYAHNWANKTFYTQIRLDPLENSSAEELLSSLLSEDAKLDPLKKLIFEKTQGTPFFIEEIVRNLIEDGSIVRGETIQVSRDLSDIQIPSSVQAILAARIDRLERPLRDLLQLVAVIGREFTFSLAFRVSGLGRDRLNVLLNELQTSEFIYDRPTLGERQYIFKHALTQEVAYNTVLIEVRKQLHEKIGLAIEDLYQNSLEDHYAQLAHHFGLSDNVDAGIRYLTDSGRKKLFETKRPSISFDNASTKENFDEGVDQKTVGSVSSLWRYPVKSMAGEQVKAIQVNEKGMSGDRLYALVDEATNKVAVVRKWGEALLNYHPRFFSEPEFNLPPPPLKITTPSGQEIFSDQSDANAFLSARFNKKMVLMSVAPKGLLVEVPAGTLGGARSEVTDLPIASGAHEGSFFDYACLHIITSSTLRQLQQVSPEGLFDVRRFRPNLVIDTDGTGFVENAWIGKTIAIGSSLVIRITIPCPRCVNVTLPQIDLPKDPSILRTIAEHNTHDLGEMTGKLPCAGVYAEVITPGFISSGDELRFVVINE